MSPVSSLRSPVSGLRSRVSGLGSPLSLPTKHRPQPLERLAHSRPSLAGGLRPVIGKQREGGAHRGLGEGAVGGELPLHQETLQPALGGAVVAAALLLDREQFAEADDVLFVLHAR